MLTPYRRGLLLVYGCTVFGDTKESVDEVNSPRFFYCLNSKLWTNTNSIIYNKKNNYNEEIYNDIVHCDDFHCGICTDSHCVLSIYR